MKQNYQLVLDRITEEIKKSGVRPSLFLHACCAPCSSYVLEYLTEFFDITLFFYNPNISPAEENELRFSELKRLVYEMGLCEKVKLLQGNYQPEKFIKSSVGLEHLSEGGARCAKCYELRLDETARLAAEGDYDYFCTTLSISPHKNAEWINSIGQAMAEKYGAVWLPSDFKKRGGYKRSCELSVEYGLYRQNFCGCEYSRR